MSVTWADLVDGKPTTGDWAASGTWRALLGMHELVTWADLVVDAPTTGDWVAAGSWRALLGMPPLLSGAGVVSVTSAAVSSGRKSGRGRTVLSVEPFVGVYTDGVGSAKIASTGIFLFAGTKTSRGNGLLYVTDVPTIAGHKQQWYFTPPTRKAYGHGNRLWRRVYIDQGVTVIRRGDAFASAENPSAEDFEDADMVYVGGYVYPIEDEERLALQAAGYDPFPEAND